MKSWRYYRLGVLLQLEELVGRVLGRRAELPFRRVMIRLFFSRLPGLL